MPAPNRDMGPCSVIWDFGGTPIELNPTFGDVTFKDELTYGEVKEDGHGVTPVDAVPTGRIVEIAFPMTRSSLTQLEVAIQGSVKDIVVGNLKVSNLVGRAVAQDAKEVVVKPLENNVPTGNADEWLHLHLAYPFSNLEWVYNPDGQRITAVKMIALPLMDTASGVQPGEMWRMGPLA